MAAQLSLKASVSAVAPFMDGQAADQFFAVPVLEESTRVAAVGATTARSEQSLKSRAVPTISPMF